MCTDSRIKIIAENIASISFVSNRKKFICRYSRINDWARLKVFHWIQFAVQTFYASYRRYVMIDLMHPLLGCATGDRFKLVLQSCSDYATIVVAKITSLSFSLSLSVFFFLSLSRQINWPRYSSKIWINIKRPSANIAVRYGRIIEWIVNAKCW